MGTIITAMQSVQVVYPQGVAWRKSPNYNDHVTNVAGPTQMTVLQGQIVQGDVQYIQVQTNQGSQFLPMNAPNGQELCRVQQGQQMQQQGQQMQMQGQQMPMQGQQMPMQGQQMPMQGQQQYGQGMVPQQYAQQHLNNDLSRVQNAYAQPGYGQQQGYSQNGKKMKNKGKKNMQGGYGGGYGGGGCDDGGGRHGGGHHGGGHHGGGHHGGGH